MKRTLVFCMAALVAGAADMETGRAAGSARRPNVLFIGVLFALALTQPATFHGAARPILQGHAGGDIVKAQALALNE